METRNLAVMLTDIKGFTSKTAGFSRAQTQELLTRHRELVLPVILKFSGRLVKTIGDAFLAAFNSPTDAVLCGVEVQSVLRAYNADKEHGEKIEIRIAINSGEVAIHDDGDIYGDAVNITSRLESIAEAGEVFFTEAVYLAMNKKEVPSSEIGYRQFKGVAEKIKVYRVLREVPVGAQGQEVVEAAPAAAAPPPAPAPAAGERAGFWRRFSASLIDAVIFGVLISALGLNSLPLIQWSHNSRRENSRVIKRVRPEDNGLKLKTSGNGFTIKDVSGDSITFGPDGIQMRGASGKTGESFSLGSDGLRVKDAAGKTVAVGKKPGALTAEVSDPDTVKSGRGSVADDDAGEYASGGERKRGVPVKMLLWALYGSLLIWRFGATPGKMILKLRVVDVATGGKPAADKAFLRGFFSLVSLVGLLGYLWAIWEKDKRTWHDIIAGTRVLRT